MAASTSMADRLAGARADRSTPCRTQPPGWRLIQEAETAASKLDWSPPTALACGDGRHPRASRQEVRAVCPYRGRGSTRALCWLRCHSVAIAMGARGLSRALKGL